MDIFAHALWPVLWPITRQGFDGIAWNSPWFVVLNYAILLGVPLAFHPQAARTPAN
jgi:hypothetical protein